MASKAYFGCDLVWNGVLMGFHPRGPGRYAIFLKEAIDKLNGAIIEAKWITISWV